MSSNPLDDLVQRITDALPKDLGLIQKDLEKNLHAAVRAGLAKMDLVTRDEFEIQRAVLARTRARLEALEKQVAELETTARE